jgi:hypothetical protein
LLSACLGVAFWEMALPGVKCGQMTFGIQSAPRSSPPPCLARAKAVA